MSRLTIIIIGTIAVVATHSGHIHLIEHNANNIFLHTGRMAQRVLHGIDFRGTPLNHEKIGIYEARRRADVHSSNKRCKINNHIIVFDLERIKKRFCRVRGKDLSRVWHPLHPPAKMPYWWLDHSKPRLQDSAFPATTSRNPALASGASARESEGWRRSQSTKMTRAPPCAMSVAIAAARVDLPSLGKHDVKPMTLVILAWLFRSTVSFIDRMASAYGDDGESMISPHTFWTGADSPRSSSDQPTALSLLAAQQAVADQIEIFFRPVIG